MGKVTDYLVLCPRCAYAVPALLQKCPPRGGAGGQPHVLRAVRVVVCLAHTKISRCQTVRRSCGNCH